MGIKVDRIDVLDDLLPMDKSKIFKHFNMVGNDVERYFTFVQSPQGQECSNRVEITLDVDYTTVASDTSDLGDVMGFLDNLIQTVGEDPKLPGPGEIINGLHDAVDALRAIIQDENVNGEKVGMNFELKVCDAQREVVKTKLCIMAAGRVSNADNQDGYDPHDSAAAFAKATLVANVGADLLAQDRTISAAKAKDGGFLQYDIVNYSLIDGTTTVVAEVIPHCRVTSEWNTWDEIAALTITRVQLFIEVIPPEHYRSVLPKQFQSYLQSKGVEIPEPNEDSGEGN